MLKKIALFNKHELQLMTLSHKILTIQIIFQHEISENQQIQEKFYRTIVDS